MSELDHGMELSKTAAGLSATDRAGYEAFGQEYPGPAVHPHSFVTLTELRAIASALQLRPCQTLLDLGCGEGGPGLWVARATGARLLGVDQDRASIAKATTRAASDAWKMAGTTAFAQGGFAEIKGPHGNPLPDSSVDAVMCIDAFLFADDKAAALAEIKRVLRPGGKLVMTTWDYHSQPPARPKQVADHRPLLTGAGFTVDSYDVANSWKARMIAYYDALLARAGEIYDERAAENPLFAIFGSADKVRAGLEQEKSQIDYTTARVVIAATLN